MIKSTTLLASGLIVSVFGLVSCSSKSTPQVDHWTSAPQIAFGEPRVGTDPSSAALIETSISSPQTRVYLVPAGSQNAPSAEVDPFAGTTRAVASTSCESRHGQFVANHPLPLTRSWALSLLTPPSLMTPFANGEIEPSYKCQFSVTLYNANGSSRKRTLPTIIYAPTILTKTPELLKLGTEAISNGESFEISTSTILNSQMGEPFELGFLSCDSGTVGIPAGTTSLSDAFAKLLAPPEQLSFQCRLVGLSNAGIGISNRVTFLRPYRTTVADTETFFFHHGEIHHDLFKDVLSTTFTNTQDVPVWVRVRKQTYNFRLKGTGYILDPQREQKLQQGLELKEHFLISRESKAWLNLSQVVSSSATHNTSEYQFTKLSPGESIQILFDVQMHDAKSVGSNGDRTGYDFSLPALNEGVLSWGNGHLAETELSKFRVIENIPFRVVNAAKPAGPQRLDYWQIWPSILEELRKKDHLGPTGPFANPEDLPWWSN